MPQLSVEDVRKQYSTRAEPLVVLSGVSLAVEAGENVAILGPSGCGKSTLLQIIGTLDRPSSGRVLLGDCDVGQLNEARLAEFRSRKIGFVFQDHHLLPQCNVLENVLLPALAAGAVDDAAIDRARLLLDKVGLSNRLDHLPAELSGGERQRAAIAQGAGQSSPAAPGRRADRQSRPHDGRRRGPAAARIAGRAANDADRGDAQPGIGGPARSTARTKRRQAGPMDGCVTHDVDLAAHRRQSAVPLADPCRGRARRRGSHRRADRRRWSSAIRCAGA